MLTVGGVFTTAGGFPVNYLARWDGAAWHDMEGGVHVQDANLNGVLALALWSGQLYVGGYFYQAGSVPSANIARWAEQDLVAIAPPASGGDDGALRLDAIIPTPSRHGVTVTYRLASAARVHVSVWDSAGRFVAALADDRESAGVHSLRWRAREKSGSDTPAGVYYLRIEAGEVTRGARVVLLP